jgi:Protein of unknown function (DUF2505)
LVGRSDDCQTGAMRFEAEHRFNGSPDAVAALLTDPQFYEALALPDVSAPEVLESSADAQQSRLRLRYEFSGSLDATARRLTGGKRLSWIQEVVLKHTTDSGQLTFNAAADPNRLHGSADFELQGEEGRCVRRLAGDLVVAVPIIGGRAERKIVPGVLRRLDIEAEAINESLAREQT